MNFRMIKDLINIFEAGNVMKRDSIEENSNAPITTVF